MNPKSSSFKPWATEVKGDTSMIFCKWCSKAIKVSSLYGPKGHLKTSKHASSQKKFDENKKK